MDILSMCIGCGPSVPDAKLADPGMTTTDNPLAQGKPDPLFSLKKMNMRRLERDAKMRSCPFRGQAYSSIMDTRFKGE